MADESVCSVHSDEQQTRRRDSLYWQLRAKNPTGSLADGYVIVVQWYELIVCRSYSRRMYVRTSPERNMRSHDRHYNATLNEDDGLSSVFLLLIHRYLVDQNKGKNGLSNTCQQP